MRWQFLDKITNILKWESIEAVKAVSFEEYQLYAPLGRQGAFPESLLIECCTELIRYLVAYSSQEENMTLLSELADFKIHNSAGRGALLKLSAKIVERTSDEVSAECFIHNGDELTATGQLKCSIHRLSEFIDKSYIHEKMREVYGTP